MTLHFSEQEQADYEKELGEVHFHTSMGFLNAHNGLRRGSMHLILGTTGGGKSTLIRTLIRDFLFKKENQGLTLALWLSEEEVKDYRAQVAFGVPSHDVLLNANAFSELDGDRITEMRFIEWCHFYKPDVLIIDNVTTSAFYMDKKATEQAVWAKKLKKLAKELNCAMIIVAHTDADVHDGIERLININDIRGSKSICNLVEFAYILQRFELGTTFFPTIRTVKHRSQELVHGLYQLHYDKKIRAFKGDSAIQFEKFKEIFNERNKLK